jgi:Argininosuccinate lyase
MEKELDQEVASFSTSIGEDIALYRYDIWGSIAHCLGLEKVGIISSEEAQRIVGGLQEIYRLLRDGKVDPAPFEDVHSLVEVTLRKKIGEVAGKLHTARSRNDQIVLDERLFLREKVAEVVTGILSLYRALLTKAEEYRSLIMPRIHASSTGSAGTFCPSSSGLLFHVSERRRASGGCAEED